MIYQYEGFELEINMEILSIKEFHVRTGVSRYGEAMAEGLLQKKEDADFNLRDKERIVIKDHAGNHVFTGTITSMEIKKESCCYSFRLTAKSAAWRMDRTKRKKVFQNLDMTYEEVIKEVLTPYTGSSFIDRITKGKKSPIC